LEFDGFAKSFLERADSLPGPHCCFPFVGAFEQTACTLLQKVVYTRFFSDGGANSIVHFSYPPFFPLGLF
jgi:hypothetical protein